MELKIGQYYRCLPVGLDNEVIGEILKIYENTVLILVSNHSKKDRLIVLEKHQRMIVKKSNLLEEIKNVA